LGEAQGEPGRHCSHLVYFTARPDGHAADGGITNLPGITLPFLASRASVLQLGIHEFAASAGGAPRAVPVVGATGKGKLGPNRERRTANSERYFLMSLSLGGGSLLQCHGGSASDCTAPPCWSQIVYTSRSSCDLRRCPAQVHGNPPDAQGVPTQTAACERSPAPPPRRAGPTAGQEGGGPWHLPWERPGPRDRGVSA